MPESVSPERVHRMYGADRAVILLSIFVMFGSLGFVLFSILPLSPAGGTGVVLIAASASVLMLATFALLRVLSHLGRHKEKLYAEDIRELEKNRAV